MAGEKIEKKDVAPKTAEQLATEEAAKKLNNVPKDALLDGAKKVNKPIETKKNNETYDENNFDKDLNNLVNFINKQGTKD